MKHATSEQTFGQAIEALKAGQKVTRAGWNGKEMWLILAHEIDFVTKANLQCICEQPCNVLPSVVMRTAGGDFVVGWLASQTDMLAEDWIII